MGQREHSMLASLRDGRMWLLILIYFCIIVANSSLTFYGPTLVKEVGFKSPLAVGWIMSVAYLCGAAGMIYNGIHSDRHQESRYHCGLAAALGAGSILVIALLLNASPLLTLVALTPTMARQAAELAATHRLRGADSVYVAVARRYGTTLVSRDDEQRARGAVVVNCQTPAEALGDQPERARPRR